MGIEVCENKHALHAGHPVDVRSGAEAQCCAVLFVGFLQQPFACAPCIEKAPRRCKREQHGGAAAAAAASAVIVSTSSMCSMSSSSSSSSRGSSKVAVVRGSSCMQNVLGVGSAVVRCSCMCCTSSAEALLHTRCSHCSPD